MKYIIMAVFIGCGLWLILSQFFQAPTRQLKKTIILQDKRKKEFFDFLLPISGNIANKIKMNEIQKRGMKEKLLLAGLSQSPEMYIAHAITITIFAFLVQTPIVWIFPLYIFVSIVLAIQLFKWQMGIADTIIAKKKTEIEAQLTHFTSIIRQFLRNGHDVVTLLETYKNIANKSLENELGITIADMKTGNYDTALLRFEARINSTDLSQIIRGLLMVARGEKQEIYFDILHHDLVKKEKEELRKQAQKKPSKLKPYTFGMLLLIAVTYLYIALFQIIGTIDTLFA